MGVELGLGVQIRLANCLKQYSEASLYPGPSSLHTALASAYPFNRELSSLRERRKCLNFSTLFLSLQLIVG